MICTKSFAVDKKCSFGNRVLDRLLDLSRFATRFSSAKLALLVVHHRHKHEELLVVAGTVHHQQGHH